MKFGLLKLYLDSNKVRMNKFSLNLYKMLPNGLRALGGYALYYLLHFRIPKNKFIIFAQGRTGSTVFVDLLNSHPDIFTFGELLDGRVISGLKAPEKFVEGIMTSSRASTSGFKVKVYQFTLNHPAHTPAESLKIFSDRGWKIIYLKRTNLFEHAISDIRSDKTGHFHTVDGEGDGKKDTGSKLLNVTFDEIVDVIKFRERCLEAEQRALENVEYFQIEYERDLNNAENQIDSLNRVFAFLNLKPYTVSTSFKKVVSKDLNDVIQDYPVLRNQLENSIYAKYLP